VGGGYLANASTFLIEVVFGLYIFAVLLRFLFQIVRADFYNPFSQAIVTVTNPPLKRLRRAIPAVGGIDTSSIVLMLVLQMISLWLVYLVLGFSPALPGLVVSAIAALATKTVYVFIGAIIILVVVSWIAPGGYSPVLSLVDDLARPLIRPVRRSLPPLGGLDLSPLVVLIGLQLVLMLVVWPLRDIGRGLS